MINVYIHSYESWEGGKMVPCHEIKGYGKTYVRREELPPLHVDLYAVLNGTEVFRVKQVDDHYEID